MIQNKATTFPFTSGYLPSSSVMANVSVRSLLHMKQKRLIIASRMMIHREQKSLSLLYKLRAYGFQDSQIHKMIESRELVLNAQRNLTLKLDFLMENGFTGELLHNLIVACPDILIRSLDDRIKPNFKVLKQYLDSDEKLVTAITRFRWILVYDLKRYFLPNIELLINEGVTVNRISILLLQNPRVFMQSHDRMSYAVKTVREFGITPDESQFISCIRVVCQLSESNLKKKLQVFKSYGWSDEQILHALKKCSGFLSLSEEKLRSKIGFYLNTIKLEPDVVIHYPSLLTCSVERVRARFELLKVLKSKNLTSDARLTSVIAMREDQFIKRYVIKYVERVPGILDVYNGIVNDGKKKQKNRQGMNAET